MDKFTSDILDKWAKVLNFDPEQTRFNLNDYSLDIHDAGKNIQKIIHEFDDSGHVALMYAKRFYLKYLTQTSICLYDLCQTRSNMSSEMNEMFELYDDFNSNYMCDVENEFIDAFGVILNRLNVKLLSDFKVDRTSLFNSISDIVKSIHDSNIEIWQRGGNLSCEYVSKVWFCSSIMIFTTMAECILWSKHQPDGIFLAYISDNDGPGGYFSYVLKLNDNIISVNDRVKESYRGQHNHSRNGRWMDEKNYAMFPYQIIEYSEKTDYLGYSKGMKVKDTENLSFCALGKDAFKLIFSMILLIKRFTSGNFDINIYPLIYSDRLLDVNLIQLEETNALMTLKDDCIVSRHSSITSFTEEDVIHGLPDDNSIIQGTDFLNHYGKTFIELYSEGFHVDWNGVGKSHFLQIEDKSTPHESEYIVTEKDLVLQMYTDARRQLADYIIQKIADAYVEFGGKEAIQRWFFNSVCNNVNGIKNLCIEKHLNPGRKKPFDPYSRSISEEFTECVREDENEYHPYFSVVINEMNDYDSYRCPITGNAANIWFSFRPRTESEIKTIIGTDVIDILRDYRTDHDCHVNHILNASDPMAFVGTPIEQRMSRRDEMKDAQKRLRYYWNSSHCELSFSIGFSKRGFNKLLKNPDSIVIEYVNNRFTSREV